MRVLRHPQVKPYVDLPRMSELAEGMVRDSLNALVRGDQDLAQSVLQRDDQVDRLRDQMFRELLTYMMENSVAWFSPPSNWFWWQKSRTHRRPRHQHRRGRDLLRRRPRRAPPRPRPPLDRGADTLVCVLLRKNLWNLHNRQELQTAHTRALNPRQRHGFIIGKIEDRIQPHHLQQHQHALGRRKVSRLPARALQRGESPHQRANP